MKIWQKWQLNSVQICVCWSPDSHFANSAHLSVQSPATCTCGLSKVFVGWNKCFVFCVMCFCLHKNRYTSEYVKDFYYSFQLETERLWCPDLSIDHQVGQTTNLQYIVFDCSKTKFGAQFLWLETDFQRNRNPCKVYSHRTALISFLKSQ